MKADLIREIGQEWQEQMAIMKRDYEDRIATTTAATSHRATGEGGVDERL